MKLKQIYTTGWVDNAGIFFDGTDLVPSSSLASYVEEVHASESPFGPPPPYWGDPDPSAAEAANSTTLTSFPGQTALTLTTPSTFPAGDYHFSAGATYGTSAIGASDVFIRFIIDDLTVIDQLRWRPRGSANASSHYCSVMRKITLSAGIHTIKIQYHIESATITASFFKGDIVLIPL